MIMPKSVVPRAQVYALPKEPRREGKLPWSNDYSDDVALRIAEEVANGRSLKEICETEPWAPSPFCLQYGGACDAEDCRFIPPLAPAAIKWYHNTTPNSFGPCHRRSAMPLRRSENGTFASDVLSVPRERPPVTIEELFPYALSVATLRRAGLLETGDWRRYGNLRVARFMVLVDGPDPDFPRQSIPIVWKRLRGHPGGLRAYLQCGCGKAVYRLYPMLQGYVCAKCTGALYGCQKLCATARAARSMQKHRIQHGADPDLTKEFGRPPRMSEMKWGWTMRRERRLEAKTTPRTRRKPADYSSIWPWIKL